MTKPKYAPPYDNEEYARIFNEGQRHSVPSAETARRLEIIETSINGLPAFMQHVTDKLNEIKEDTGYTNGKVAGLVKWQNELTGAKKALWGVWTVGGIFVIAGIFTLFSMWSQLQKVDYQLSQQLINLSK